MDSKCGYFQREKQIFSVYKKLSEMEAKQDVESSIIFLLWRIYAFTLVF